MLRLVSTSGAWLAKNLVWVLPSSQCSANEVAAWLEDSSDHASDVQAGQLKQALVLADGQAPSPAASSHYEVNGEGWYGQQANLDLVRLVAGALAQKTRLHVTTRVRQLLLCCLYKSPTCTSPQGMPRPPPHTSCQDRLVASQYSPDSCIEECSQTHPAHGLASSHVVVLSTLLWVVNNASRCRAGRIALSLEREASREPGALADWHGGAAAPLCLAHSWLAQRITCCLFSAWSRRNHSAAGARKKRGGPASLYDIHVLKILIT